jgi:uracil-DNA glycosylase
MLPSNAQRQYLQLMGIDVWCDKSSPAMSEADIDFVKVSADGDEENVWQNLREEVASCTQCSLHQQREQTVFGVGDVNAEWMVIGEAPGAEEDQQGEPFVGKAGKLLNAMLIAAGLKREQVYIANVLKCRPPENRDPQLEEVSSCQSYLQKQIKLVKPKIILVVGAIAAQNLLQLDLPIGKMRGQSYQYPGSDIPVVVTYHPTYLLYSPKEKPKSWQDLQLAMRLYSKIPAM